MNQPNTVRQNATTSLQNARNNINYFNKTDQADNKQLFSPNYVEEKTIDSFQLAFTNFNKSLQVTNVNEYEPSRYCDTKPRNKSYMNINQNPVKNIYNIVPNRSDCPVHPHSAAVVKIAPHIVELTNKISINVKQSTQPIPNQQPVFHYIHNGKNNASTHKTCSMKRSPTSSITTLDSKINVEKKALIRSADSIIPTVKINSNMTPAIVKPITNSNVYAGMLPKQDLHINSSAITVKPMNVPHKIFVAPPNILTIKKIVTKPTCNDQIQPLNLAMKHPVKINNRTPTMLSCSDSTKKIEQLHPKQVAAKSSGNQLTLKRPALQYPAATLIDCPLKLRLQERKANPKIPNLIENKSSLVDERENLKPILKKISMFGDSRKKTTSLNSKKKSWSEFIKNKHDSETFIIKENTSYMILTPTEINSKFSTMRKYSYTRIFSDESLLEEEQVTRYCEDNESQVTEIPKSLFEEVTRYCEDNKSEETEIPKLSRTSIETVTVSTKRHEMASINIIRRYNADSKRFWNRRLLRTYAYHCGSQMKKTTSPKKGTILASRNLNSKGKVNYTRDKEEDIEKSNNTSFWRLFDLCAFEQDTLMNCEIRRINPTYDEEDEEFTEILYEDIKDITPAANLFKAKPFRPKTEVNDNDDNIIIEDKAPTSSEKSINTDASEYQSTRNFEIVTDIVMGEDYVSDLAKDENKFVQDSVCTIYQDKGLYCRECIKNDNRNKSCRFINFRKLCTKRDKIFSISEFLSPKDVISKDDITLWTCSNRDLLKSLDDKSSKFLLSNSLNTFCKIIAAEKEAYFLYKHSSIRHSGKIAYKAHVRGVRELCDVCETTIFNYHWICDKCGYVVCIDCYKNQNNNDIKVYYDQLPWMPCTDRSLHYHTQLLFTQIIPDNFMEQLQKSMHDVCIKFMPELTCDCNYDSSKGYEMQTTTLSVSMDDVGEKQRIKVIRINPLLTQTILKTPKRRNMAINENQQITQIFPEVCSDNMVKTKEPEKKESDLPLFIIENRDSPIQVYSLVKTIKTNPNVLHEWFCFGKLLRLMKPGDLRNYKIFQNHWIRGQPVIVSNVSSKLNPNLWHPSSFSRDFGHITNDLINCFSGNIVPNQLMSAFWDGFEDISRRLRDSNGMTMLLKLKDWPHGDDFAEVLPTRFEDLMNNLPLGEYTRRTGKLNLASRLPDAFVRPDLGPKMYNAYGSAHHLQKGTTNLHLDISDAVNIMIYVGVPIEFRTEDYRSKIIKALLDADCDRRSINNIIDTKLPGAIWHIYDPKDAVRIRDLLNKLKIERGEKLVASNDPIHDQNFYLDKKLRFRLSSEYGVQGYAIIQCLGDSIFIPAGAPHQVRNLYNCIKVAEDFVSSENVGQCYFLTQEFRKLSRKHANREDKLQIKNIVYHSVKDAVNFLSRKNIID